MLIKLIKVQNLHIFTLTCPCSGDMSTVEKEQKVMQACDVISIGTTVAAFLIKTNRVVKGIQLAEECLIFLNNTELREKTKIFTIFFCYICFLIFKAYRNIYDYTRAIEWGEKLLEGTVQSFGEFSDEVGSVAIMLADLYRRQLKCEKAKELLEKALRIKQETGNRDHEATCYSDLGAHFHHLGQYHNFKKCVEKALEIRKEIGDKMGIAECYGHLGIVFEALGQYDKAMEYIDKSLLIRREIGDREGEARDYIYAGKVCHSVGEYAATVGKNFAQKALAIQKEIGDREEECESYNALAAFFCHQGQVVKAVQYLRESLLIAKETGRMRVETFCYLNLGIAYCNLGEYAEAKKNIEKALKISKETGDVENQLACHYHLGWIMMFEGNTEESISNLFSSIQNCEELRSFLGDHA